MELTTSSGALADPTDGLPSIHLMKIHLSIYRLGGALTLDVRIKTRRSSMPKLLIPLPNIWQARLVRA